MRRVFLLRSLFSTMVMFVAVGFLFMGGVQAATIYVDVSNTSGVEDGTIDHPYNTINEGKNNASHGDTVKVAPGTYIENVSISSLSIKLIGDDPAVTTIQGTTNVIDISGTFSSGTNTVEIAGFTITGGGNNGIRLNNSTTVKGIIHNNIILGNEIGIYADHSDANIYNNSILHNTAQGIYAYHNNTDLTVNNNIIMHNGTYGIEAHYDSEVNATYNDVWSNSSGNYYAHTGASIGTTGNISQDALFLDDYYLSSSSPCIDSGRPLSADNDPDGTRNDQGAYGGPGAANFWPEPAGGPVVTNLSVTPPSVPVGGTLTIQATGKIR